MQPTYKYKPGTISEFKKFTKRVPGWCDRVLFATWADGEDGAGTITKKKRRDDSEREEKVSKRKGAKVELYRSFMTLIQSDHKPVRPSPLLSSNPSY
jgi:phosphatidylinositol-bisphosphatase